LSYIPLLLSLLGLVQTRYECQNYTITVTNHTSKADFLFIIDASNSMDSKIAAVNSGLNKFAELISTKTMDARFAIVIFGYLPKIKLPFTSNTTAFRQVMLSIDTTEGGQEASFEAIRMALQNDGNDMDACCTDEFGGSDKSKCNLTWRQDSTRVIILATDEDSDLPHVLRVPGQTPSSSLCYGYTDASGNCLYDVFRHEPTWGPYTIRTVYGDYFQRNNYYRSSTEISLSQIYQNELDLTANMLLSSGVYLNLLYSSYTFEFLPVSYFDHRSPHWNALKSANSSLQSDSRYVAAIQFGSLNAQVQDSNFTSFDVPATLNKLVKFKTENSLQYKVLSGSNGVGLMRVFDIDLFASGGTIGNNMVNAFYQQLVYHADYLQQSCTFIPEPSTTPQKTSTTVHATTTTKTTSTTAVPASTTPTSTTSTTSRATSTPATTSSTTASSGTTTTTRSTAITSSLTVLPSPQPSTTITSTTSSPTTSSKTTTSTTSLTTSSTTTFIGTSDTPATSTFGSSTTVYEMTEGTTTLDHSTTTVDDHSSTTPVYSTTSYPPSETPETTTVESSTTLETTETPSYATTSTTLYSTPTTTTATRPSTTVITRTLYLCSSPTQTSQPINAPPEKRDDNVIGGAVGGIVAGLAAIVAGVVFYRSRVGRPIGSVAGSSSNSLGNIVDNPLYNSRGGFENPLYQNAGSTDNLMS
ncbi:hypothetical protein MP638_000299, partial [Amoeboaphelidium occidentale]